MDGKMNWQHLLLIISCYCYYVTVYVLLWSLAERLFHFIGTGRKSLCGGGACSAWITFVMRRRKYV